MARAAIDQRIMLTGLSLYFDTGRLVRFSYSRIAESPAPFPEEWKNFPPIGDRRIKPGMAPEEFDAYIEAWEKRAAESGKTRGRHFQLRQRKSGRSDLVTIAMQPSRVAVSGAMSSDIWRATFLERGAPPHQAVQLVLLEASRGEFNSRPPSPIAESIKELRQTGKQKTLSKIDLPKPEVTLPEP